MNLLNRIRNGEYQTRQESHNHRGWETTKIYYVFENGVELETYTRNDWFLRIDGKLISKPEELSNNAINQAFQDARNVKLKGLVNG